MPDKRMPDDAVRPWQALYPDGLPFAFDFGDRTILHLWRDVVASNGCGECIRYFDASLNFDEVHRLSTGLASWLAEEAGVRRGERVVLLLQNIPHFVIALLAIWRIGAIPVPCNPMYRATELAELFDDCAPVALIVQTELVATARTALDAASVCASLLAADPHDWQTDDDVRVLPPRGSAPDGQDMFATCCRHPGRAHDANLSPDDIGLILYTSGTTGRPKGAAISHRSIAFNSVVCGEWMKIGRSSRVLAMAPLFHITGFILHLGVAIHAGCPMALTYRFHPELVLDTIRAFRPTFTIAAITAFNALMACGVATPADFASFETVFTGGAPVAPALRDRAREMLGVELLTAYGMTETCSPTHIAPPGRVVPTDPDTGALAVGIPIPSTDARISDAGGSVLAPGQAGEVWMRGPQIMTGYWNKPAETAETLSEGWLRSGDVGVMDQDGWLFIVDRQKDMINASGFKVWPRQVEDVLLTHPAIREAAVVGEADDYRGETVHAFVSLKRDVAAPSLAALCDHCREQLAAYKVPRRITILAELPKTATGKLQRAELRRSLAS